MGLLRLISGLLDRLAVVVGAFFGSQIPAFFNQYAQKLAGHAEELNYLLGDIRKNASLSGKTLEQYIQKFLSNTDPDFVLFGEFMQKMVVRYDNLSLALRDLVGSTMWERPYFFLKDLQHDIAESTLKAFQPSITLTIEGLCYTSLGLLFGFLIYRGIASCLKWIGNLIKKAFVLVSKKETS